MLNQVILVGRLVEELKYEEGKPMTITLAIPRSFKNADGEYDIDFITAELGGNIAQNTSEYCSKGDIIGIKGRMEGDRNQQKLVAEKVTFLCSKPKDGE